MKASDNVDGSVKLSTGKWVDEQTALRVMDALEQFVSSRPEMARAAREACDSSRPMDEDLGRVLYWYGLATRNATGLFWFDVDTSAVVSAALEFDGADGVKLNLIPYADDQS